ncbi:MAG: primosomal protein N' [Lachnospiraceae bacterium]|nr:primosomal protein N' [Lachnospiraceae bacterium]
MAQFADIIIDITHEKVDRPFQYRIPPALREQIHAGCQVDVPFGRGNTIRCGYVVGLSDQAEYDPARLKEIAGIHAGSVSAESQLIQVAWWMKERYGSTMNQALKTVLPVKQQVKQQESKWLRCLLGRDELNEQIREAVRKKYKARERLLKAFLDTDVIPYQVALHQLNLTAATLKPLIAQGVITLDSSVSYRNPSLLMQEGGGDHKAGEANDPDSPVTLNDAQQPVVDDICRQYDAGVRKTYLIHGITGSGKTEIYMELIDHVRRQGKQVILLIPEIALTYQTVMRFCRRFGSQVSFINSKLSAGEKYDQFERAKNGEIQIMIGPRSALFTPFRNLGLIIIDEEHEGAYKSEITPRYHARETAEYRAGLSHASLVLGSATPSVESYTKAVHGIYGYYKIGKRAKKNSYLPKIQVVDLRNELAEGNRSIFSRTLHALMVEKLTNQEQIMLFLNRRGYSRFLSCRSCGEAIKCPHCDVTLTLHQDDRLVCHYCGYQIRRPSACPSCGSAYLAPFGTGTQKIEALVKEEFPDARVLRMDLDTTAKKGGHEEILAAFAEHEADILIGTQMIVKGHDFPAVTLVGILAADLSLYAPDYRCGERTFQLLTQAAGRAGRDEKAGDVVIQTYSPDHYCIQAAAAQDYERFYEKEMEYRKLLHYPPACVLMTLLIGSDREELAHRAMDAVFRIAREQEGRGQFQLIGPVNAPIYKLNDIYRKILYMKCENYDILIGIRNHMEEFLRNQSWSSRILVQFDFS